MQKRILYSEHLAIRKRPENLLKSHVLYFEKEFERKIPASQLVGLGDVKVTKEAVVFDKFRLEKYSITSDRISIEFGLKYRIRNLLNSSKAHFQKEVSLSFDSWYFGYFRRRSVYICTTIALFHGCSFVWIYIQ